MDVCPDSYDNFPEDSPPLTCNCSAEAVKQGDVRGANPYQAPSSICMAAVHAGVIGSKGGQVVVTPAFAVPVFPASTRNGVTSLSRGKGDGFRVQAVSGAEAVAPDQKTSDGVAMDICPDSYDNFPEDSPPLTCTCSAEAAKEGDVRGANPYQKPSSICMAAVHAGAIGPKGGQVVVTPAFGIPVFPATTRNGVTSLSRGKGDGFRVEAVAGAETRASDDSPAAKTSDGVVMDICPDSFDNFPEDSPPLTCNCSAEAVKRGDVRGANPYQKPSSICMAGVHAGVIGPKGGQVVVTPAFGIPVFPATTRNGVTSLSRGKGDGFRVEAVAGAEPVVPGPKTSDGMTMDVCPDDYENFPEDSPALTCTCSAEAVKQGDVRGANPYQKQSSLCMAGAHAGVISPKGGQVVVTPAIGIPVFPATTRNGFTSLSRGKGDGFRVEPVAGARAFMPMQSPAPKTSDGVAMDVCPDNYENFPEDFPTLTCNCSAEAMKRGDIRGANPYQKQSSLCMAGFHAGAIGAQGGQIVVTPAFGIPVFPATTRNGLASLSRGKGDGFRVEAAAGAQAVKASAGVDASGKPIQAPIASTLKETGRVQVYINFATGSDRLDPDNAVLMELLETLRNDPKLRIDLIGHTDTQGSSPYNLDLSQRRAAAVYGWLGQHGIDRSRLASSGRGFLEPIADNATDEGRALNRRVEVRAID